LSQPLKGQNWQLRIGRVKPSIPLKLKLENSKLLIGQDTQIVPDSFDVSFAPMAIFKGKKIIKFQSYFPQGSVKGHLLLKRIDPFLFSDAKAVMSGVKISNFKYKTKLADITMGCELNGDCRQAAARDKKDSWQGKILIHNFSAQMKNSLFNILNLPIVDFFEINSEFVKNRKKITVQKCLAKGTIINVKLKGQVDIVFPLQKSRLNFTGVILRDSPYLAKFANLASIQAVAKNIQKDGIKFYIKGTLKNPKIGL